MGIRIIWQLMGYFVVTCLSLFLQEHWTTNAILRFRKLCSLKPLVGVVDEYVNGILHLFLCDTTSDEDIYIHQVLRVEGHAVICRENIPSKVKKLRGGKFEQDC